MKDVTHDFFVKLEVALLSPDIDYKPQTKDPFDTDMDIVDTRGNSKLISFPSYELLKKMVLYKDKEWPKAFTNEEILDIAKQVGFENTYNADNVLVDLSDFVTKWGEDKYVLKGDNLREYVIRRFGKHPLPENCPTCGKPYTTKRLT